MDHYLTMNYRVTFWNSSEDEQNMWLIELAEDIYTLVDFFPKNPDVIYYYVEILIDLHYFLFNNPTPPHHEFTNDFTTTDDPILAQQFKITRGHVRL